MAYGFKSGGRQKGTVNKISATVRDNVVEVFDTLGGTKKMVEWAKDNLAEFYRLYAKLLPTEAVLNVNHANPIELTEAELADIASAGRAGTAETQSGSEVPSSVH